MFQLPPQMRDSASPNEADQLANMTSFLSVLCFFLPLPHAKLLFRIRSCRKELRRHLWLSKLWSVHGGVVLSYQLRRSYPRNTIRTFYPLKFHALFPIYTKKDTRDTRFTSTTHTNKLHTKCLSSTLRTSALLRARKRSRTSSLSGKSIVLLLALPQIC